MGLALEVIAIGLVALLAILAFLFGRREVFARAHGTVELYLRLRVRPHGRGWAPGFAQFRGDELRWYRMFSLAPRPRRRLSRRNLTVVGRRSPSAEEALLVPAEWLVLACTDVTGPVGEPATVGTHGTAGMVEIAMPRHTVTGFLSWLEAAAPSAT